ncbi:MAG TPA: MOSC domain-containing protein [Longimicrobiales bacterium]
MRSLHIAPERWAPMVEVREVRAVAGRGIEGDRYFDHVRRLSRDPRRACAVTLIEEEALEALEREFAVALAPGECRRNVVTHGIRLNALVGREFRIGSAVARGLLLCEPCRHLEKLTGRELIRGLLHRGGLRAEILRGGRIEVGDPVAVVTNGRTRTIEDAAIAHR